MSDPLDAALRGLRGQHPPVPFAAPEAVRRRGRQRTTRQAVTAGVAVLAVIGATAGWLNGYDNTAVPAPGASTTPPPPTISATSPSPSVSAPATQRSGSPLLQVADLGPGSWVQQRSFEMFDNGKSIWSPPRCQSDRAEHHPTTRGITAFDGVFFRDASQRTVGHAVETYARGTTGERLREIRAQLQRCHRTTRWPDGTAPTRYTVTGLDGIGDEAFLVRSEAYGYDGEQVSRTPLLVTLDVVLRVGDRVATVRTSIVDEAFARTLGEKAAARLR